MAATITTTVDPDTSGDAVFLVTRRELAVLAAALAVVVAAILLLVITGSQVAGALLGPT